MTEEQNDLKVVFCYYFALYVIYSQEAYYQ